MPPDFKLVLGWFQQPVSSCIELCPRSHTPATHSSEIYMFNLYYPLLEIIDWSH